MGKQRKKGKKSQMINNENVEKNKNITLTWKQILILIGILMLYHLMLVIYSLGMFVGAYATNHEIGMFIDLISDSADGTILTLLLACGGIKCLLFSCLAVFLLLKSLKPIESPRLNKWLRSHVYATGVLILFLFILGISIIGHSYGLHENLEDGIVRTMKQYNLDNSKKVAIDRMQIKFQCCGSQSYKEWFDIEWYDPLVGGAIQSTVNRTVSDSTPFSCCLIGVLFPCIHHHLLNRSDIYTSPKGKPLSISTEGCHSIIKDEARLVGWLSLLALIGIGLLEVVGGIGMRIVQTAHSHHFKFVRHHEYLHVAWLCRHKKEKDQVKPPKPPPMPSFLVDDH